MNCFPKETFVSIILIFIVGTLLLMLIENGEIRVKFKPPEPIKAHLNIIKEESQVAFAIQPTTTSTTTSGFITTQRLVVNYGTSIIYSSDNGRLGNQLSSFSDLLSIEWEYGVRAFLKDSQYEIISLYFESPELNRSARVLSGEFPDYEYIQWVGSYPPDDLQNKSEWPPEKFGAFYQAGCYINNIYNYHKFMPRLKKIFKFKPFLMNEAKLRLQEVKNNDKSENRNFTFVSIHLRRTDFGHHLKVLFNLTFVEPSYFLNAMEYYNTMVENPIFYVLSDEPEWAEIHLTNNSFNVHVIQRREVSVEGNVTLTHNDHIGIDLALLSLANHSIISYGTFGMWGAFFSGGMITMPFSHSDLEGTAFHMKRANLTNLVFI